MSRSVLHMIAAQALSSNDQLEAGVRAGDPSRIQEARHLLQRWSEGDENEIANLNLAVREMLRAASEGDIEDILMALKASRKLAEAVLNAPS